MGRSCSRHNMLGDAIVRPPIPQAFLLGRATETRECEVRPRRWPHPTFAVLFLVAAIVACRVGSVRTSTHPIPTGAYLDADRGAWRGRVLSEEHCDVQVPDAALAPEVVLGATLDQGDEALLASPGLQLSTTCEELVDLEGGEPAEARCVALFEGDSMSRSEVGDVTVVVAGRGRSLALEHQYSRALLGAREMLGRTRNSEDVARVEHHRLIAHLDRDPPGQTHEEFVGIRMRVPRVVTFDLRDSDLVVVDPSEHTRCPAIIEPIECFIDICRRAHSNSMSAPLGSAVVDRSVRPRVDLDAPSPSRTCGQVSSITG
jgi:hypothetical protein